MGGFKIGYAIAEFAITHYTSCGGYMTAYVYPACRYMVSDPSKFCVVHNEDEDRALDDMWDDPAGVRKNADLPSAEVAIDTVEVVLPVVERKKPGRKPRVQP